MKSLKGQLLIAAPQLVDPNFHQAVLLIVEHGPGGAMGLILNRGTDAMLADAVEPFTDEPIDLEVPLLAGGPCQGPLMVVHSDSSVSDLHIGGSIHFSTERESVESLLRRQYEQAMYFIGYAGWAPGQLESELDEQAWHVVPVESADIFDPPDDLWEMLINRIEPPTRPADLDRAILPDDPSVN